MRASFRSAEDGAAPAAGSRRRIDSTSRTPSARRQAPNHDADSGITEGRS